MYSCTAEVNTNPDSCPHSENKTVKITVKETYIERVDVVSHESFLISSTVNIECIIILNTPVGPGIQPTVTWYHDATDITLSGSLLRNNDIVFISVLTINSIQVSDAGVYQCNAGIDSNVTTESISVCVTVNETLPSVTEELSLGQYYSIDCITGPVPTGVSVSWLLTNGSIYSNNNTLMIPSILPSHNNTQYNCTIMIETNPSDCSTQSQTITLRVKATYINSVILLPTSIVSVDINSTVELTCTISLNTGIGPDTSFISHYWYQYRTDISDRSTQLMISGDSKSLVTTLNITNIRPSDAGEYQCRASIDGNDTIISSFTNLCVQVPGSVITINDSYTDLTIGDTIKYDCASGYRQPGVIIQWRSPTGALLTNPLMLTVNQSVTYTCIIRVEANTCQNSLTKNVTFKIRDTFVKEVTTSSSLLTLLDTFQQLKCNSTTNTDIHINVVDISSIVQISWYRYNGRSIESMKISTNSSGVSISPTVPINNTLFQSTLIFSPITSSTPVSTLGNYTCVAWIGDESGRNETSNDVQVLMKINNSRDLVSFNQLHFLYTAGDDLVINCTITPYEMSPLLSTFATIELIHNKVSIVEPIITSNEYTNITISKDFNGVKLSDAGTYTCQYYLECSNFTSFVLPSEIKTDDINLFVISEFYCYS
ncbi:PREDICTED: hemicentin-1-like [Amphimedon queenslandica]|uniref:Ig-like domain-containing protein n=1 Tax=Amphimedon queenslandica TaxID=400682 RepID=A0AAN0JW93_AMPQE|nr:PREDICTED: hemicentin-1-like [Amphimedon queenslandica]|eukprot:XP_019861187.1 PREDICTED: hemicentin-1-like [Amphimedon queenslandica]